MHKARTICIWVLSSLLVLGATPLTIHGSEEISSKEPAAVVDIGLYVLSISEADLRAGTCVADFWVWVRWQDAEYDPLESLEVIDGTIEEKTGEYRKDLGNGWQYATVRIKARIRQVWDVNRFPLDTQRIVIALEDAGKESHEAVFSADETNSRLSPHLRLPGWVLGKFSVGTRDMVYETNYGDTTAPTGASSSYSRFSATLDLHRPDMGLFYKLFAGLFVAVGIALLSLTIRPTHLDPRFGLPVGAMFAAIASQYVISAVLPESTDFTLADKLHVLSMAVIFVALVESVLSLTLCDAGWEKASRRLDYACSVLLAAGVIAAVGGLIVAV